MEELVRMAGRRRARVSKRWSASRRERREMLAFHLFTLPWTLGFVCLSLIPLVLGLLTSFTNYDGFNLPTIRFLGARNYVRAFVKYAIINVPIGLTLSLSLALMLNQSIGGQGIFRTLFYIPSVLPLTGSVWLFRILMNQNTGLVNALLSLVIPGTAINWFNEHFFGILWVHSWWHAGGAMVLFLAGLQGIPEELYEAARLDGANRLQMFKHVTIPLLTPVIFFQMIMGILGSLQILNAALLFGRGGNMTGAAGMPRERFTYMVYQYIQVFEFQRFGYGVALAWIFFVIVLVLTGIVLWTARFWVYYEVPQGGQA